MFPSYMPILVVIVNTLLMLAYFQPRHPISVFVGTLLFCFPLALRQWVFGGAGAPFHASLVLFLYLSYSYLVLCRFVAKDNAPRALFSFLVMTAHSYVFFVVFDTLFLAAGIQPMRAAAWTRMLYCLVVVLCLPLLYRYIRPPFREILNALDRQPKAVILIGQFSVTVFGAGLDRLVLHEQGSLVRLVALAGSMSIAFFYVAIYLFIRRERANQFLRSEAESAERLVRTYDFYGTELAEREGALRRLRHDFRHQAVRLLSLAREGDETGVGECLRELGAVVDDVQAFVYCENTTVNALLSSYFAGARADGTHCEASIRLPRDAGIPDAELAVLFGNALENACKAARPLGSEGYIDVRAGVTRRCLVLHFINNSLPGTYEKGSGFGMMSMRLLCAKYDGDLQIEETDGRYEVTAILQQLPAAGDSHGEPCGAERIS